MAFQMNYTDSFGRENPQSYWKATSVYIGTLEQKAFITFEGFSDHTARNTGKKPIAKKQYTLLSGECESWFSAAALAAAEKNPFEQAYIYALQKPEGDAPPAGDLDLRESFFSGALSI